MFWAGRWPARWCGVGCGVGMVWCPVWCLGSESQWLCQWRRLVPGLVPRIRVAPSGDWGVAATPSCSLCWDGAVL
jgi:hypothetical protein